MKLNFTKKNRAGIIASLAGRKVIHLRSENVSASGFFGDTYQGMTSKENWLAINKQASSDAVLLLENPTRYPQISSQKHKQLATLSKRCGEVIVLDIVPFTKEIRNFYSTLDYVGADNYAWKENYQEMLPDGSIISAHDPRFAASKAKGIASIDYQQFSAASREVVRFESTPEEHEAYAAKKDALFAKYESPQKIVTRLADHAHAYQSRIQQALEVVAGTPGNFVLYHNLGSYAKKMQTQLNKAGLGNRAKAVSYEKGFHDDVEHILYVESPIVNSYFLLDAEAQANGKVFHLLGDTKVDIHLFGEIEKELAVIDSFAGELYRVTH